MMIYMPMTNIVVLALAAAVATQPPVKGSALTPEEVQVVVAALNQTALREARRAGLRKDSILAVLSDATLASCRPSETGHCIRESTYSSIARLLGAANPLVAALAARNASSSAVPQFLDSVLLVPPDEIEAIFKTGGGWEEVRARFGRAVLVHVSAPAIQGEHAAVYVTFGCGGLCGKSWLVTLERRRGEFRVKRARIMTIA